MDAKAYGYVRQWATRRAKHGASGLTDTERVTRAENMRRVAVRQNGSVHQTRKTHCPHGHRYSGANLIIEKDGSRKCRACVNARRRGRPSWIDVQGARVSLVARDRFYRTRERRLRKALIAAHADHGGSSAKFRIARCKYDTFIAGQLAEYAGLGMDLPHRPILRRAA